MDSELHFVHAPIVAQPLRLPSHEVGACVEFSGIVRELEAGMPLTGIRYEAYEPMARRMFGRIFSDIEGKHPARSVTVIHRLGWVPVGEASLFVRVLAKHRGPALGFCGEVIDRMKADVPIWKT